MSEDPRIARIDDPAIRRAARLAGPGSHVGAELLLEDAEPIVEAAAAGLTLLDVYASDAGPVPDEVTEIAAERGLPVRLVAADVVAELFRGERRARVFALAAAPAPATLDDLAAAPGDLVVLDGVRIVGNIGAIVRTASALGAAGVLVVDGGLASVADRRLVRASRAYVFSLPVALAGRDEAAAFLTANDYDRVVLDAGGSEPIEALRDRPGRMALVLGAEKTGPSAALADGATIASIPMRGHAESLNVSVSAGIALHARGSRG